MRQKNATEARCKRIGIYCETTLKEMEDAYLKTLKDMEIQINKTCDLKLQNVAETHDEKINAVESVSDSKLRAKKQFCQKKLKTLMHPMENLNGYGGSLREKKTRHEENL